MNIVYNTCYRSVEFTLNTAAGFILIQSAITKWSSVDSRHDTLIADVLLLKSV